jgi:GH24 family phage-related lysozyme (muramidase)
VTFIDIGYKAYDATRGFLKSFGGENFVKVFDAFNGAVGSVIEAAIIASIALASQGKDGVLDIGMDLLKDRLLGQGAQAATQAATSSSASAAAGGGASTAGGTAAQAGGLGVGAVAAVVAGAGLLSSALGEGAFQVRKFAVKPIQKLENDQKNDKNPFTRFGRGVALNMIRPLFGLFQAVGVLLDIVGAPFRYAIELLRYPFLSEEDKVKQAGNLAKFDARIREDFRKALNMLTLGLAFKEKGSFGNIYGNQGAQKEMMGKMAGGGITRGGKSTGKAKRTFEGMKKKQTYKRTIAQKPTQVEIKPGADVGGEDKIFGIFPNPFKAAKKVIDTVNPFNVIKTTGEDLGKTDYFGPILAITSKMILGQQPDQIDYKNVGLGLNLLIAKGVQDGQLKGGIIPAFAEGGLVDPDVLSAVETGGDISSWVSNVFRGKIETGAQKTMRLIKENADKERGILEEGKSGGASGDEGGGSGGGIMMGTSFDNSLARLLKSYEGLRTSAYRDAKGIPTIGMGATYYPSGFRLSGAVKMGQTITEDEALWIKMQHIKEHRNRLLRDISTSEYAKVPDNVKAALESKTFNYGSLGSTLAGLVKEGIKTGNYKPVSDYFRNTLAKHDGGLNSWRRNDEARLIDRGISQRAKVSFPKSAGGQAIAEYNQRGGMADEPSASLPSGVKGGSIKTGPYQYIGKSTDYHIDTKFHKSLGMGNMVSAMDKLANAYSARGRKIEFSNAGVAGAVYDSKAPQKAKQSLLQRAIDAHSHSTFMRSEGFLPFDYYNPKKNENRFGKSVEGSEILLPTFGGKVDVGTKYGGYGKSAEIFSGNKMVAMTGHGDVRYEKGGETLDGPHLAMVGEEGREIVIDNDSTESDPQVKEMLLAINQASNYQGVLNAIRQYAPYDVMSPQTIIIPSPSAPEEDDDYGSDGGGGGMLVASGVGRPDPYSTLYQGA